jgi:hypothetical protein
MIFAKISHKCGSEHVFSTLYPGKVKKRKSS